MKTLSLLLVLVLLVGFGLSGVVSAQEADPEMLPVTGSDDGPETLPQTGGQAAPMSLWTLLALAGLGALSVPLGAKFVGVRDR